MEKAIEDVVPYFGESELGVAHEHVKSVVMRKVSEYILMIKNAG